jgi:hypothetical protein
MTDTFTPSESYEQRRLVGWFKHVGLPDDSYTSIPLGGLRDARTAAILKLEGAREGWTDLIFATMPPIALEMKRKKGGRVSPAQIKVHDRLRRAGWTVLVCRGCVVCRGCEEAKSALLQLPQFLDLLPDPRAANNPSPAHLLRGAVAGNRPA